MTDPAKAVERLEAWTVQVKGEPFLDTTFADLRSLIADHAHLSKLVAEREGWVMLGDDGNGRPPRDADFCLLGRGEDEWGSAAVKEGRYCSRDHGGIGFEDQHGAPLGFEPTHWMPLPPAPIPTDPTT